MQSLLALLLLLTTWGVDPDCHSHGNPDQLRPLHLSLDIAVDFERSELQGSATWTLDRLAPARELVLDARELVIERVSVRTGEGKESRAGFRMSAPDPVLGSSLAIEVPDDVTQVTIQYRTVPGATALQWLTPEQTATKKSPFLFTQSQAIHARSWIPCMDSPGVRTSYEAKVTTPRGLTAVMSAETVAGSAEEGVFRFRMPQAIPSYLIALAVGVIEARDISPRVRVYAEPSVVDRAAFEFADTEKMVQAAERLFGPYRWDRYDMIVLPPSFPFGGMENPRLSFLTPTVLAGDRSLVDLVAHELAHSWSGNLVTNASWGDLWINEGFTVYLERRIVEEVYGEEAALMNLVLGWQALRNTVDELGDSSEKTVLSQDLRGLDPDEVFSDIPYEKGALLLHRLEELVGREALDAFLRGYFDAHAFGNVSARTVEIELRRTLLQDVPPGEFDLDEWLYGPGIPGDAPIPRADAFLAVEKEVSRLVAGTSPRDLATTGWRTQHWLHFLRTLPRDLDTKKLRALDEAFSFTSTGNSEILFSWAQLSIGAGYEPVLPAVETFLRSMGRSKFLVPLYTALRKNPATRERARKIYSETASLYHPISRAALDRVFAGG